MRFCNRHVISHVNVSAQQTGSGGEISKIKNQGADMYEGGYRTCVCALVASWVGWTGARVVRYMHGSGVVRVWLGRWALVHTYIHTYGRCAVGEGESNARSYVGMYVVEGR